MNEMNAVICPAYGPPEILTIKRIKKPAPKPDEVLVKVIAASVNSGDARVRGLDVSGFQRLLMRVVLGWTKPRKPVLGTVLSGIVVETGSRVSQFKPGDEIMASTGFRFGAHAEFACMKEKSAITLKPKNAGFSEAAAILFGGQTAHYFLKKAGISEGKSILIFGASGAVGTSAVQIAAHFKADITAVCSTQNMEFVRRLGSQSVFDYTRDDVTRAGHKFDIIFDAVGKLSRKAALSLLNPGGRFVTVDSLDVADETVEQMVFLRELFEAGRLDPVIEKEYDFREVAAAHRHVDSGRKRGNVVIRFASE